MIVVSDTGPLHYLCMIGHLDALPALYGREIVSRSVVEVELADPATPAKLKSTFSAPPSWLDFHDNPSVIHPLVAGLGLGERCAISLLIQLHGDLLLCDDAAARKRAVTMGVSVIGTLGILDEGAMRGLLDFDLAVEQLTKHTNFRHSPGLIQKIRQQRMRRGSHRDIGKFPRKDP